MKSFLLPTILFAAFAASVGADAQTSSPTGHVYALQAQNGSGETGTFALKPHGQKTTVEIHLLNAPAVAQPAHLHVGPCAKLNPAPKYGLKSVVNGISETSLDVPMATLLSQHLALNVHKSTEQLAVYVACGNLE